MQDSEFTDRLWQALVWVLVLFMLSLLVWQLVTTAQRVTTPGADGALVDFDAFYIVGQLSLAGRGADAYDIAVMTAIQGDELGQEGMMPWNYPPPYHLITMALASVPRGLAFGLFVAASATAYLAVIALLAGRQFPMTVLALMPPVAVTFSIGQNAFLIGALVGAVCWLSLRPGRAARAGYPLGLLVIKPHLGLGLGIHALASGNWAVLWRAAVTALAVCLLATLVLGVGIWAPFLHAVRTAGTMLDAGGYPIYRMLSVHALARTLGLSMDAAGMIQVAAAILACGLLVWIVRSGRPLRHSLAAACFVSALISPYFYDYDMLAAGIGLALVMPELARRSRLAERVLLIVMAWLAGGWGVLSNVMAADLTVAERFAWVWTSPAIGAAAYLLLIATVARILYRRLPQA